MPAGNAANPRSRAKQSEASGAAADEAVGSGWRTLGLAVLLVSLFVLPMLAGNYLARVEDAGPRLEVQPGSGRAGGVNSHLPFGEFKFGPDLAGGITLIYELAEAARAALRVN